MKNLGVGIVLSTCTYELRDSYRHCAYKCASMYVATLKSCKFIKKMYYVLVWCDMKCLIHVRK